MNIQYHLQRKIPKMQSDFNNFLLYEDITNELQHSF